MLKFFFFLVDSRQDLSQDLSALRGKKEKEKKKKHRVSGEGAARAIGEGRGRGLGSMWGRVGAVESEGEEEDLL